MTNLNASDLAGRRIREARQRHGWTVRELADRCAKAGASQVSSAVITNLETRRRASRQVTVEELLVLAHVLAVPPAQLMIPLDAGEELEILPGVTMGPLEAAGWIAGGEIESRRRQLLSVLPAATGRLLAMSASDDPFTLTRQIAYAARWIEREDGAADSLLLPLLADRLMHLAARMEALGYDPPGLDSVREILQRHELPSTLEEWHERAEADNDDDEEPGSRA